MQVLPIANMRGDEYNGFLFVKKLFDQPEIFKFSQCAQLAFCKVTDQKRLYDQVCEVFEIAACCLFDLVRVKFRKAGSEIVENHFPAIVPDLAKNEKENA